MKVKCAKCGKSPALHGIYLERTSEKGQPFLGVCKPSCDEYFPNEALVLMAIEPNDKVPKGISDE